MRVQSAEGRWKEEERLRLADKGVGDSGKENRGRREEQAKTHRVSMFLAKNFIDTCTKQRL